MADTGVAKLPGIPTLRTDDRALAEWSKAVAEHLEVRNGARGNPSEKTVVQRDLESIQAALSELRATKTEATEALTNLRSADPAAPPVNSSTLNADVARVELALNAALEALRSRIARAEDQIAASSTGSGPVLNPALRIGSAGGSTLQTLEDRLVLGTAAAKLNQLSVINGGSGGPPYTMKNFTDDVAARLISGTVPCSLNAGTSLGVEGVTFSSLLARVKYLEQRVVDITTTTTNFLQNHDARIAALEARP